MTPRPFIVALVGNPNAGKSTLFNALSGLRQHTGNYPGVTVELKKGRCQVGELTLDLIDLPGTYSLAPRSPDEMVSVDLLLGRMKEEHEPDVIVSVVDASNLDRHLYLTTQLMAIGKPVILAVNMIDVAKNRGITIDATKLAESTGLPVVMLQANQGTGVEELKRAIVNASSQPAASGPKGPVLPAAFSHEAAALRDTLNGSVPPFLVERLLLDVGGHTETWLVGEHGESLKHKLIAARTRLMEAGHSVPGAEMKARFAWVRQALAGAVKADEVVSSHRTDRLDSILTHKVWGTVVFLAIMFAVFQLIFVAATPLMDGIKWGQSQLSELVTNHMPAGPARSLLTEGVIQGVGSVIVFLPQILILFGLIAILEDCGYMARAAYLMDKVMSRAGLSGKSFIPLLSSVACAVPGIMATRVIENRRDRFATILVAPLMSCSARLPVYSLLIGSFLTVGHARWVPGATLFGLYLIGFVTAPLMALLLKRTLLRGATPVFVMELPTYKMPSFRNVFRRMYDAGSAFIRRAGTLIFATMVLIWAAAYFPGKMPDGTSYETAVEAAKKTADDAAGDEAKKEAAEQEWRRLKRDWKRDSYLGQFGRALEPAVAPLGWDWKLGTATLASFPAREVIVGTLGLIYEREEGDHEGIGTAIQDDWKDDPIRGKYGVPVAVSVMVFFALCCQCASTLAVIKRETNSWRWPAFTFVYMTALAYLGAFVAFRIGKWIVDLTV
ncbi:MAG: ferrous iron transport protein B [Gemmataceae bacterium]